MRRKTLLSAEVMRRLGRPLTPEEADLLNLAETILEERAENAPPRPRPITVH